MAENADGMEKTEPASSKRLSEARNRGQVARSMEVTSAALLLFGGLIVYNYGGFIFQELLNFTQEILSRNLFVELTDQNTTYYYRSLISYVALLLLPILAAFFAIGVAAEISQVGFHFATEKFTKGLNIAQIFNPFGGIKKMLFSKNSMMELAKGIVKIVILGLIVFQTLASKTSRTIELMAMPLRELGEFIAAVTFELVLKIGFVYAAIAALDFFYQKYRFNSEMKMTKQEVKEESKQAEGDAQVKGKIRQLGMQRLRKLMLQKVKQADVVITNPTHYAVALEYKQGSMSAPRVVAKGVDHLAFKIREIATGADVPIVENVALARALYASVEVDEEIPESYFQAVAQVLAYVFQINAKKKQSVWN